METKDWILLLIPIAFNGLIVFLIQKMFERKQSIKKLKIPYVTEMIRKIDVSLEAHAKGAKFSNERDRNNQKISQSLEKLYFNTLEIYVLLLTLTL